jgi:hypothetical protein
MAEQDDHLDEASGPGELGTIWHFDPSGGPLLGGCKELRNDPVTEVRDWDSARAMAESMTSVELPDTPASLT